MTKYERKLNVLTLSSEEAHESELFAKQMMHYYDPCPLSSDGCC